MAKRHLDMVYTHIRYSDKPFMGSVTAPERAADSVAMAEMVFGKDFVDQNCVMINLINANSPMVFDGTMLGALKVYARANQATVISPFIVAGAMSAVTTVGTLTQILAEASVGIAFTQLCRPGAPVVFGTFASSMSMQSGAPTFGTPEPAHVHLRRGPAGAPHGRALPLRRRPLRLQAPRCAGGLRKRQHAVADAARSGVNFCLHAAGWLEGGLASGYEKLIMDADQLTMFQKFAEGVDFSENGQALDAIREVGPGSHYPRLRPHAGQFRDRLLALAAGRQQFLRTVARRRRARTSWRAPTTQWKKMLRDYEAPALDQGIDERFRPSWPSARKCCPTT